MKSEQWALKTSGQSSLDMDKSIVIPVMVHGKSLKVRLHFLGLFYEAKRL